jgi:hypothetical protein
VLRAAIEAVGGRPKRNPSGWQALCPAHDDSNPSLSFGDGRDGRAVIKCHAGCDTDVVLAALNLSAADLFPPEPEKPGRPQVVARYPYPDEQGAVLYEIVRREPGRNPGDAKSFHTEYPNGKTGRRVVYNLPDVIAAVAAGHSLYLVEGEKDADRLTAAGVVATTSPHGAGKWKHEYAPPFTGGHVTVIADRDDVGIAHAHMVAASLRKVGCEVRLRLPATTTVKSDVSDHLDAGHTLDQLVILDELVDEVPPEPEPPPDAEPADKQLERRNPPIDWSAFLVQDLGKVDWHPGKFMARGQLVALVGDGKAGKSMFMQEWAWRAAAGLPFLGDRGRDPLRVLYVDHENSAEDLQERMLSFGATAEHLANLIYLPFPMIRPLDTREGGNDLIAEAEDHGAEVVVLDTISRMFQGKENDSDTWLDLYRHTLTRLKRRRVTGVRLDHFGKDKDRGGRGSSAKTQDVDHVWELTVQPGGLLKMKRTHTRSGHGEDEILMRRQGRQVADRWARGETRHVLAAEESGQATTEWLVAQTIARKLDDAGVPQDAGRDRVKLACAQLGIKAGTSTLVEVVRYRKTAQNLSGTGPPNDLQSSVPGDEDRSI